MKDKEEVINILNLNIEKKIKNKEAAELMGVCTREFSRIKKKFVETGVVNDTRGCTLPFDEEKAQVLFAALVNKKPEEKLANVLKRVCIEVNENFETKRKSKIYSYPSLFYYVPQSNQIVVPLKYNDEHFGGIMFEADQRSDDIKVNYVDEMINRRLMTSGKENENYIELIRFIINIMSKTYFKYVKDRTKEQTEPIEKFKRYYQDFSDRIKECKEEEKLKNLLYSLFSISNSDDEIGSTLSSNACSPEMLSPLPSDDEEEDVRNEYKNERLDDNCHFQEDYRIGINNNNSYDDEGGITLYLSPPPSPHFIRSRSVSRSRSRSPLRDNYHPPGEEIFSFYRNVGFSPT